MRKLLVRGIGVMGQLSNMAGVNHMGAQKALEMVGMALEAEDHAAAIVWSSKAESQLAQIRKWAGTLYTDPYAEFEEGEED